MNQPVWLSLRFPRQVTSTQGLATLLALTGLSTPRRRVTIIVQAVGTSAGVAHQIRVPAERHDQTFAQLQTHMPGLLVEPVQPRLEVDRAWRAWQSTTRRSLTTDQPETLAHGLLSALASAGPKETLVVQWLLGPVRRPQAVASRMPGELAERWPLAIVRGLLLPPADMDADGRRALRQKQALPGWKASLRIGVQAKGLPRQRQLLGHLAAAVRVAQGPGVELGFDGVRPGLVNAAARPWWFGLTINVAELLGLTAWPLGDTDHLPVVRVRSRALPPTRPLARTGHVIGQATYPGQERPVAMSIADSLMHTHLVGATGSGKSTAALNLIVQDMQAGRAVAVVEPKNDLIEATLARVPEHRRNDVVLIDPTRPGPVVGLNPLAQRGVSGEVITDQILAVFKGLFGEAIGPRTQDLLTAGLLTLTGHPDMTLVALPLLFTDAHFRHQLVNRIDDRLTLGPFWAWYEGLSRNEQAAVLAPLMNKLRTFLLRPRLRRVIGQPRPRFDIGQLYTERKILLVSVNKGVLGPESAGLLGSLALSMLWQATLSRSAIAPERRHATFIYVDEFQDYLHLPQDFSDVLSQARGLGTGLVLAHQHLGQLTPTVRAAVLANARSRIVFTTSLEDAAVLVKGDSRLKAEDVSGLGRFEAYASLLTASEPQPFASIRTLPAPSETATVEDVVGGSQRRYGVPAKEIDQALVALVGHESTERPRSANGSQFGVKRRSTRPGSTPKGGP